MQTNLVLGDMLSTKFVYSLRDSSLVKSQDTILKCDLL